MASRPNGGEVSRSSTSQDRAHRATDDDFEDGVSLSQLSSIANARESTQIYPMWNTAPQMTSRSNHHRPSSSDLCTPDHKRDSRSMTPSYLYTVRPGGHGMDSGFQNSINGLSYNTNVFMNYTFNTPGTFNINVNVNSEDKPKGLETCPKAPMSSGSHKGPVAFNPANQ